MLITTTKRRIFLLLVVVGNVHPFHILRNPSSSRRNSLKFMSSEKGEKYVEAFSDYMIRSHEEKLKAMEAVDEQKQAEIELLEAEIKVEMQKKILLYQDFMSKYMVDAQKAKYDAVCEVEVAMLKKYETKLSSNLNGKEIATIQHEKKKDDEKIIPAQQKQSLEISLSATKDNKSEEALFKNPEGESNDSSKKIEEEKEKIPSLFDEKNIAEKQPSSDAVALEKYEKKLLLGLNKKGIATIQHEKKKDDDKKVISVEQKQSLEISSSATKNIKSAGTLLKNPGGESNDSSEKIEEEKKMPLLSDKKNIAEKQPSSNESIPLVDSSIEKNSVAAAKQPVAETTMKEHAKENSEKKDDDGKVISTQEKQSLEISSSATKNIKLEGTLLKNPEGENNESSKKIEEEKIPLLSEEKNIAGKQPFSNESIPLMDSSIEKNAAAAAKQPYSGTIMKERVREDTLQVSSVSTTTTQTKVIEINNNKDVSSSGKPEELLTSESSAATEERQSLKENDEAHQELVSSEQQQVENKPSIFETKSHAEEKNSDSKKKEGVEPPSPDMTIVKTLKETVGKITSPEDYNIKVTSMEGQSSHTTSEIPSAADIAIVSSSINSNQEDKKNKLTDSVEFTTTTGEIQASGITATTALEEDGVVNGTTAIQDIPTNTESVIAQEQQGNNKNTAITINGTNNNGTLDVMDKEKLDESTVSSTELETVTDTVEEDDSRRISTGIFLVIFPTLVYFWSDITSFLNTIPTLK